MYNRGQRGTGTRAAVRPEAPCARYERLAWKLHDLERGIAHFRPLAASDVPAVARG